MRYQRGSINTIPTVTLAFRNQQTLPILFSCLCSAKVTEIVLPESQNQRQYTDVFCFFVKIGFVPIAVLRDKIVKIAPIAEKACLKDILLGYKLSMTFIPKTK